MGQWKLLNQFRKIVVNPGWWKRTKVGILINKLVAIIENDEAH